MICLTFTSQRPGALCLHVDYSFVSETCFVGLSLLCLSQLLLDHVSWSLASVATSLSSSLVGMMRVRSLLDLILVSSHDPVVASRQC